MDEFAEYVESELPEGWSIHDPEMSPEFLLEAPDGCIVEQDGRCSHGNVSPMRAMGLV